MKTEVEIKKEIDVSIKAWREKSFELRELYSKLKKHFDEASKEYSYYQSVEVSFYLMAHDYDEVAIFYNPDWIDDDNE
jgi:hypothetical protein